MNQKLSPGFVQASWEDSNHVRKYRQAVAAVGLWESEKALIQRHWPADAALLDAGCGAGRVALALSDLGFAEVTGCDLSATMIAAARQIAAARSAPVRFDVADVSNLPYAEGTFGGAIFSAQGLMCIPGSERRLAAVCELRRVLGRGGVLIFSTHDRSSPTFAEFWSAEEAIWDRGAQDPRLLEFGDRIVDDGGRPTFVQGIIYFPSTILATGSGF